MKLNEVGRIRKHQIYYSAMMVDDYNWNISLKDKILRGDVEGRAYDTFKKLVTNFINENFDYKFKPVELIPTATDPSEPSLKEEYWPAALTAVYIVQSKGGKYLFEESSFWDANEGELTIFPSTCSFQMLGSNSPILRVIINYDVEREST